MADPSDHARGGPALVLKVWLEPPRGPSSAQAAGWPLCASNMPEPVPLATPPEACLGRRRAAPPDLRGSILGLILLLVFFVFFFEELVAGDGVAVGVLLFLIGHLQPGFSRQG